MRMRLDMWSKERESATVDEATGLKILRRDDGPKPVALIWRPKATRPYAHYSFRSVERREAYIAEQIESEKKSREFKATLKAERAGDSEALESVKVGDIFCHSWGYDQTNVDFYQVIAKSGRSVTVREIGAKSVEGSAGFMSDRVIPAKDAFLEKAKPIKKLVQFSQGSPYLSFEHGWCSKVKDTAESHYRSWYA